MSTLPTRDQVPLEHQWDLSSLYGTPEQWEADLARFSDYEPKLAAYEGRLGESADVLAEYVSLSTEAGVLEERLGYYAMLRQSEDLGDSNNQSRYSRFMQVAARVGAATSFFAPELQHLPADILAHLLGDPRLEPYRIALDRILRYREHTLSPAEEKLLALQEEANQTASRAFGALVNVDLDFGEIETPQGPRPLTQSSYNSLLEHSDRDVRRRTFDAFYREFDAHRNSLAALFNGSVQLDVYRARVRGFASTLEARLFPDDVPVAVYDNLVSTVRNGIALLHRHYEVRRKALGLDRLAVYDTRVALATETRMVTPYESAVDTICAALAPLGDEYIDTLRQGLLGGWVDRYENKGKRSGAFSAGSYVGNPYILMNYKDDTLRDVFTLAHEAGHSMHSWYSVRSNPFQHYQYTIFEAEVASTFNEQLLMDYLLETTSDDSVRLYLVTKHLDDIVGTLFRQTMFAEFERETHRTVEAGGALTVDSLRAAYRGLLELYFGDGVELPAPLDLEGLRIPHFYRSFYVYKYATGISAAIALADRVRAGGSRDRDAYFSFLKSGGSRFPIESLRIAGVDMGRPEPVEEALRLFQLRLGQLEEMLDIV